MADLRHPWTRNGKRMPRAAHTSPVGTLHPKIQVAFEAQWTDQPLSRWCRAARANYLILPDAMVSTEHTPCAVANGVELNCATRSEDVLSSGCTASQALRTASQSFLD